MNKILLMRWIMSLLAICIIGLVAILVIAGAIWAVVEGAPFIGFIILALVVGFIVVFLSGTTI